MTTEEKEFNNGVYRGDLKNGKREGRGVLKLKTGDRYEGFWKDDQFNGEGTYAYANGGRSMGERQERGTSEDLLQQRRYYYFDGAVKKGQWENDKLVSQSE